MAIRENDWKATPLNVGIAIAILASTITVISWSFRAQDFAKDVAKEVIVNHSQSEIESSHPGIKRYVSKGELQETLMQVKQEIRTEQRASTEELKELIIRLDRRNSR